MGSTIWLQTIQVTAYQQYCLFHLQGGPDAILEEFFFLTPLLWE